MSLEKCYRFSILQYEIPRTGALNTSYVFIVAEFSCGVSYYRCEGTQTCIPRYLLCDHVIDCLDKQDDETRDFCKQRKLAFLIFKTCA